MQFSKITLATTLCFAGTVYGQSSDLSLTFGIKGWHAQWTTWASDVSAADNFDVITQVPAKDKLVVIPVIGLRYRDFVASLSAVPETEFEFQRGANSNIKQKRKELDVTLGYYVAPSLSIGLGYKQFTQKATTFSYNLAGPSLALGSTASLSGPWSMYGSAAIGRMEASGRSTVKVNADYRLTEVGLVYSIATGEFLRAISLTAGYRMQVVNARNLAITNQTGAFAYGQDGRDLTQGFTLGIVATF